MTSALISIHPQYAERIYKGEKRFEFRTRQPKQEVSRIYIYETAPVGAVTGFAEVGGVLSASPSMVWDITRHEAGITRDAYREYFKNRKLANAYILGDVHRYSAPINLRQLGVSRPPQSFVYLNDGNCDLSRFDSSVSVVAASKRVFVCGMHGVGKTTYSRWLSDAFRSRHYSSGELIQAFRHHPAENKAVDNNEVAPNQDLLVTALEGTSWFQEGGFLDGHCVLFDTNKRLEMIPFETYRKLDLDAIHCVYSKPERILARILARDKENSFFDANEVELVSWAQDAEREYAKEIARRLAIPYLGIYR